MKYKNIVYGTFFSRANRFVGKVIINGVPETVHIKNTGRCAELLVEGNKVILEAADNPLRKTKYDLVSVYKGNTRLINMDSQLPNACVEEWLKKSAMFSENAIIRREVTYGNSRFDIFVSDGNRKAFIEVKGVTLEKENRCYFPDAPTVRGIKHINELIKAKAEGYEAYIFFVIQMKNVLSVSPNNITHPQFGAALSKARENGVSIIAYDCDVLPDSVEIAEEIPVFL